MIMIRNQKPDKQDKRDKKEWLIVLALLFLLFGFGLALYLLFFTIIATFWSLIFEFFYFFFLLPVVIVLLLINRKNLDQNPVTSEKFAWPLMASLALVILFHIKANTTLLNNFPPSTGNQPVIALPINPEKPAEQEEGITSGKKQNKNQEGNSYPEMQDESSIRDVVIKFLDDVKEKLLAIIPNKGSQEPKREAGPKTGSKGSAADSSCGGEKLQKSIEVITSCLFPGPNLTEDHGPGCAILQDRVGSKYTWQIVSTIKYRYLKDFDSYDIYLLSDRNPDTFYLCQGASKCAALKDDSVRIRVNDQNYKIIESQALGYSEIPCVFDQKLAGEDQAKYLSNSCWNYRYNSNVANSYRKYKEVVDAKAGCYAAYPGINKSGNNLEPEHAPY